MSKVIIKEIKAKVMALKPNNLLYIWYNNRNKFLYTKTVRKYKS